MVTGLIVSLCLAAGGEALRLEKAGTAKVYFTHNGKPLLSFGGLSDFIFYAAEDAYDYRLWTDWAADHGMNHIRAYPPLSWKHIEKFARENGGAPENMLFPYQETEPGSRQFDLMRFNAAYWQRFRRQCEYLRSKGIIIHLLMWNGWQLRAADTPTRNRSAIDWEGHFFNPANNVNSFTSHLGGDLKNRFAIYHSVADGRTELVDAQKAWFVKLIEETAGLDNVYYDLVHELAEHSGDWEKTRQWITTMTGAVRRRYGELQPGKTVLIGMDTGGLSPEQRDWIFSHPYFELLIYGKKHTVGNAVQWRKEYKKPYIPQESWDDHGKKYRLYYPGDRVHIRKYMWKFVMSKCQQLDLYMKPLNQEAPENAPRYPHNYDPRGYNRFEQDAVFLRQFWNRLTDYPNLWFRGRILSGPGKHQYVLSSSEEALVYVSSDTGQEGVRMEAQQLLIEDLALPDGAYEVNLFKPDRGVIESRSVVVKEGSLSMELPAFIDDLALHLLQR